MRSNTCNRTRKLFVIACVLSCFFGAIVITGCEEEAPSLLFDGEYLSWIKTVEEPLTYPVPGHGERRRVIFMNDIGTTVEPVIDESGRLRYDYPDGTIVLKEVYVDTEGSELASLTIMIKDREDERARGGWIWINKDATTGDETIFSESTFCLTCHLGADKKHPYGDRNEDGEFRDHVFFPYQRVDQ